MKNVFQRRIRLTCALFSQWPGYIIYKRVEYLLLPSSKAGIRIFNSTGICIQDASLLSASACSLEIHIEDERVEFGCSNNMATIFAAKTSSGFTYGFQCCFAVGAEVNDLSSIAEFI